MNAFFLLKKEGRPNGYPSLSIMQILFIAFVQDVFDEMDGFEYHAVAMGLLFPAAGLIHAQKVRAVEAVLMMIQEGFVESGDSRSVFDTQEAQCHEAARNSTAGTAPFHATAKVCPDFARCGIVKPGQFFKGADDRLCAVIMYVRNGTQFFCFFQIFSHGNHSSLCSTSINDAARISHTP